MAVRVLDLELTGCFELPSVSARYDAVRLLVRLRGVPLGYVEVANAEDELAPHALARSVMGLLGEPVWAELVGQSLETEEETANGDSNGAGGAGRLPLISVVVCTRDRPDELEQCLAALAAQRYPLYEISVVDNAPHDDATRRVVERWAARYVLEPRPGLDWARNRGLAEAQAPIVAFTDDDARPDPGWLEALAAGFAVPDVHAVTGPVVPAELETRAQALFEDYYGGMGSGFGLKLHSRRGRPLTYQPNVYGTGCNMAFRRETLERLGGFDTALDVGTATGGGGDLDVLQRVIEGDGAIAYRPDALVRHVHRRTRRQLRRQLFDNGRGFSAVLWAALGRARRADRLRVVYWWWLWIFWWHARRLARRLLRREPMPLRLILWELVGALLGPGAYWLARRRARRLAHLAHD